MLILYSVYILGCPGYEVMSDGVNYSGPTGGRISQSDATALNAPRCDRVNHHETIAWRPPLFSGISQADYERICASGRTEKFKRGEFLYLEGHAVEQVILLTTGFVKITQLGKTGNQVILKFGIPGEALGAASLYATGRHYRTAQAIRGCQTLVWDARAFRTLVGTFPVLQQNLVRLLGADLQEIEERFREVATERVASRVARQVLRLMQKIGRPVNGEIEISLSREELAQMTGTTLFTVSRLLSRWEARGVVKPRREGVTICDIPSLRVISESKQIRS